MAARTMSGFRTRTALEKASMVDQEESFLPPLDVPIPPRGHPVLAWFVITALIAGTIFWQRHRAAENAAPTTGKRVGDILLELQGRYLVGAKDLVDKSKKDL